jgi:phospholipid/cholesterol/gamma-HCH transport system substrate-binding protein
VIRQSSLLGENYVELRLPDGDPRELPRLEDGDTLEQTATAVELEDLVREATGVIGAITAGDVDTILQAGVEGIGGRGGQLNGLLERLADLSTEYASYGQDVDAVLDGLAELGTDLADGSDQLVAAIDAAAAASAAGVRQRDRLIDSLDEFARFSRANTEEVLEPYAQDLTRLAADLVPVTRTLAGERERLLVTLDGLVTFADDLAAATPQGPVEIFGYAHSEGGQEEQLLDLLDELRAAMQDLRPPGGAP